MLIHDQDHYLHEFVYLRGKVKDYEVLAMLFSLYLNLVTSLQGHAISNSTLIVSLKYLSWESNDGYLMATLITSYSENCQHFILGSMCILTIAFICYKLPMKCHYSDGIFVLQIFFNFLYTTEFHLNISTSSQTWLLMRFSYVEFTVISCDVALCLSSQ